MQEQDFLDNRLNTDEAAVEAGVSALELLADEFESQHFDVPHDQPVYHYTSPDGLLGIIKDKGINLRFTRYDCVNDFSEGKDVIRCYALACRAALNAGTISRDFFAAVCDIELDVSAVMSFNIDKRLNLDGGELDIGGGGYVPIQCEAYICCFSLDGDSLPMWNYYSKKGVNQGYNVCFEEGLTEQENMILDNGPVHMEKVSVIYNDAEKIRDIQQIIESVYKISGGDANYQYCRLIIKEELKKRMFRYKSPFFMHEQESRLVLFVPIEYPERYRDNERLKIKYTTQNGYIVPYVDIVYRKELLRRITVGPLLEKDISIRTLETIKTNYTYSYEIVTSNVPIRF